MAGKPGPKNIGPQKYFKAYVEGSIPELIDASLKEASRLVTELENWKKDQIKFDPQMMLDVWEDSLIPLVQKAVRYRYRIYAATKRLKEIDFELIKIAAEKYGGVQGAEFYEDSDVQDLLEESNDQESLQMVMFWKIKKIHTRVRGEFRTQFVVGDDDPFAEYEYDPEKS